MMNARRPHFLEVFLPNLSSDRLKVPSKFVKHLESRTSGSLSLTGPSGNSWHVDLIEYNGDLFFHDGWPTFVKDHSIQCGDSLVFRYDGDTNFTVQIFDQSSCEKDEAFCAECSQGPSEYNVNHRKKREREREASFLNVVAEKKMRGSWMPVHLDLPAGNGKKELDMCSNEGQELEGAVRNGNYDRTQKFVTASMKTVVLAIPAFVNDQGMPTVVNYHSKKNAFRVKKAWKKKQKCGTQKTPSISKFIESRASHYFTSSFPYFIRVMSYSNISGNGTLKIPVHFSMAHFPNCRVKVTLKNLNGDCWMINSVPTARLRSTLHTFCGGWLAFVRSNSIKMEDVCIFELVDKFEMRVRILRLGLEGLDNQTEKCSFDVCGVGLGGSPLEAAEDVPLDTNRMYPPKDLELANEPHMYDIEGHKITERMPDTQEEAASFIGTSDDATALLHPVSSAPFPISRTCNNSSDELVVHNARGTITYQKSKHNQVDLRARSMMHVQPTAEEASASVPFTSPFPSFLKVMMSSNVGGSYTLAVPRKFSSAHLPCYKTEIVLRNLRGDSWNVISSRYGHQTKFCGGWMSFVRMNNVKVGDICVFELLDERVLQVRIFERGHRGHECVSNDVVADDSTASVESTRCAVLPET